MEEKQLLDFDSYKSPKAKKQTKIEEQDIFRKNECNEGHKYFQKFKELYSQCRKNQIKLQAQNQVELKKIHEQFSSLIKDDQIYKMQIKSTQNSRAKSKSVKQNWSFNETCILIWVVLKLAQLNQINIKDMSNDDWEEVSTYLNRRSGNTCFLQWNKFKNLKIKYNKWTAEEDEFLQTLCKNENEENQKWSKIASQLIENTEVKIFRTGRQCRERWMNYLNPNLKKAKWTEVENQKLIDLINKNGQKWAFISKCFNYEKNEHQVKNQFNSLKRKELLDVKIEDDYFVNVQTKKENKRNNKLRISQKEQMEDLNHTPESKQSLSR